MTSPMRMQCYTKDSDNQSQHCASKSLHVKSSTKEGRSSILLSNEIGRSIGGSVKL